MLVRGAGRSYGDAAQNAGGVVLTVPAAPPALDARQGRVEVSAGTMLRELAAVTLPRGWSVAVTPGTADVTVGGAIAADVHGKNHPNAGSFGACVESLALATAEGELTLSPASDPQAFWATVGGMGLTGMIRSARLRLRAVDTGWLRVDDRLAADLDAAFAGITAALERHEHAVAWLDCRRGRGIVTGASHATLADLGAARGAVRFPVAAARPLLRVPSGVPRVVNGLTIAAYDSARYRLGRRRHGERLVPLHQALYPLDAVGRWPQLYGRRGLLQYQCVTPRAAGVERVLALVARRRVPAFLGVLKRLGPSDPAPLSFPREGWTLAVDFPAAADGLGGLLDALDEAVVDHGGRVYLAKDGRLRPELLPQMYPRLGEWRLVRDRLDPGRVFRSDLARRLRLVEA